MSSLIVDFIISLDGYGAADGSPGYWGMEGPEISPGSRKDGEVEHTALMGATTYRLMSGYADEMPDDPGLAGLTATPKVVFSSTLKAPLSWANTELVEGDAVEAVQAMKRRDSPPLRTVGSLSLCRSLLGAGVVDRFRVVVFPVITGATGKERIFDEYPDIALDLVESRTFDGRLQLLEYVPVGARPAAWRRRLKPGRSVDQQPIWRIGSQTPPSRMMMPCDEVTGAPATGCDGVIAADAGPGSARAAVGEYQQTERAAESGRHLGILSKRLAITPHNPSPREPRTTGKTP